MQQRTLDGENCAVWMRTHPFRGTCTTHTQRTHATTAVSARTSAQHSYSGKGNGEVRTEACLANLAAAVVGNEHGIAGRINLPTHAHIKQERRADECKYHLWMSVEHSASKGAAIWVRSAYTAIHDFASDAGRHLGPCTHKTDENCDSSGSETGLGGMARRCWQRSSHLPALSLASSRSQTQQAGNSIQFKTH